MSDRSLPGHSANNVLIFNSGKLYEYRPMGSKSIMRESIMRVRGRDELPSGVFYLRYSGADTEIAAGHLYLRWPCTCIKDWFIKF